MSLDEQSHRDLDMERLMPHVEQLAAKFDTVQVFVTRHDVTTECTVSVHSGSGNWHARCGQVREWMMQQDEFIRMSVCDDFEDGDE